VGSTSFANSPLKFVPNTETFAIVLRGKMIHFEKSCDHGARFVSYLAASNPFTKYHAVLKIQGVLIMKHFLINSMKRIDANKGRMQQL
jgi:hypothetical protein